MALSIMVADAGVLRDRSPDGWTRQIELTVAVQDPSLWNPLAQRLEAALAFLTGDIWSIDFIPGGEEFPGPRRPVRSPADAVMLLSGGLDSLIGGIDLSADGRVLLPVSQTVRGDADKQVQFARAIGAAGRHLQLNHNVSTPRATKETSSRARSLIFLAFAVLAATSTEAHRAGGTVPLYLCENGFIAMNPPMTAARIGSLSTRTAHPEFLGRMQEVLAALGLNVAIENPYRYQTKGEMMNACADQSLLQRLAVESTSCGRFQRFGYRHCGRCVPCQIRRASFLAWARPDTTDYVYRDLALRNSDHAHFDDVRSVGIAIATVAESGLDRWLGTGLGSPYVADRAQYRSMLERGLTELANLHASLRIL
ncbi:MAG: hypothetical protein J0G30_12480 [Actinomycetales bacterium]|nr:hypothetical protein [Actinomycetales bacterium]